MHNGIISDNIKELCPPTKHERIGDGWCDGDLNLAECAFDLNDCCIEINDCSNCIDSECICHVTGLSYCHEPGNYVDSTTPPRVFFIVIPVQDQCHAKMLAIGFARVNTTMQIASLMEVTVAWNLRGAIRAFTTIVTATKLASRTV